MHAFVFPHLQHIMDLVGFPLTDQAGDPSGIEHHLGCCYPSVAIDRWQQALGQDP